MRLGVRVDGLGAGRERQRISRLDARLKAKARSRRSALERERAMSSLEEADVAPAVGDDAFGGV